MELATTPRRLMAPTLNHEMNDTWEVGATETAKRSFSSAIQVAD
jgi:hypothetical protein